jgi:hypothetical protein
MAAVANRMQPFVTVSVAENVVHVEHVAGQGFGSFAAKVMAHVTANCPHQVAASFSGFKQDGGEGSISDGTLSLSINGTDVPVGKGHAAIIKSKVPTPRNGVDVPLELKVGVNEPEKYTAGCYSGTLTLTVIGGR